MISLQNPSLCKFKSTVAPQPHHPHVVWPTKVGASITIIVKSDAPEHTTVTGGVVVVGTVH